jgi:hypothetical protein
MRIRPLTLTLAAALACGVVSGAAADTVTDWNAAVLDAIRVDRTNPPRATRNMALMNVSIFDAVNGVEPAYQHFHVVPGAPAGASPEAAAAAAAHRVLSAVYPAQQAAFDDLLAASLLAVPDGPAEDDGVAWGEQVADAVLALREDDGSSTVVDYLVPTGANWWEPTPPAFAPALLPNWATVTPWCLPSSIQLRQPAPPPLSSPEYAAAYNEVRILGDADSAVRTADQTEIALFWNDGAGTHTPPGHWNEITQGLSAEHGLTLLQNARLFALQGLAVADAAIVSWENKYHWNHWRPYTGILHSDLDGNDQTGPDPGWQSLIVTPPFPSYTSGHSTFSGSSSRLLELFFGTDDLAFSAISDGLPGVTRDFASLSQAAEEAGQSRIYGGIHWQYDNTAALASGRALGEHVWFNFLRPLVAPSTCAADGNTLCLSGGRFEVEAEWRTAAGDSGPANVIPDSDDAGRLWFFNADNTEMVIKVLDACAPPFERFWVFASGLTDVQVTLTVTDTETGAQRIYFNPQDRDFPPVLDTAAFDTCP